MYDQDTLLLHEAVVLIIHKCTDAAVMQPSHPELALQKWFRNNVIYDLFCIVFIHAQIVYPVWHRTTRPR